MTAMPVYRLIARASSMAVGHETRPDDPQVLALVGIIARGAAEARLLRQPTGEVSVRLFNANQGLLLQLRAYDYEGDWQFDLRPKPADRWTALESFDGTCSPSQLTALFDLVRLRLPCGPEQYRLVQSPAP